MTPKNQWNVNGVFQLKVIFSKSRITKQQEKKLLKPMEVRSSSGAGETFLKSQSSDLFVYERVWIEYYGE